MKNLRIKISEREHPNAISNPLIWPVVGNPPARRRIITRPLRSFEGGPVPFVLLHSSGDTLRGRFSHASVSPTRLQAIRRGGGGGERTRAKEKEKKKDRKNGDRDRRRARGNETERSVARREMNVRTRLTFSLVRVDFYRMQAAKHCAPNL